MRTPSAFVISITPFGRDGEFDEDGARRHLGRMRDAGIGVYVGGGGSGEGYTLSTDETARLLEIAVEELKGIVPVRAMGVEPRTAAQMIDFMGVAKAAGVDAAQLYSLEVGHGHLPTMPEVERYLTDVLEQTPLPCVISTHQSVGYQVPVDLLARLVSTYEQVIGINCSHADAGYLRRIVDAVHDDVEVHVGGEAQALLAFSCGASGFLSSAANTAPRLAMSVVSAFAGGDLDATLAAYDRLVRLSTTTYINGGIVAQKAVLGRLGLAGGYPRLPHLPASDGAIANVEAVLGELDIADSEGWSS